MRTVGLLGGMTYEASALYYKIINDHVRERLGGQKSASIILHSFNFQPLLENMNAGRWGSVIDLFTSAIHPMKAAGAEAFVICANYPHKVADEVVEKSGLPVLHIADFTATKILRRKKRKVGLLGAKAVMEEGYIKDRMRDKFGVEVLVPDEQSIRDRIHEALVKNLTRGVVTKELRELLISSAEKMIDDGAEGIILGSTDLAFALKPEDVDVELFDTNLLHAKGVGEWVIQDGSSDVSTSV
ncbi:Asp/Glu racemase [Neohortaea acidophila]|uniref:Asp/Glu racemase n=1 Tax=Neohortaea acidophila TaxID=245834 RepID=A0A6A6Q8S0_9PEZI|nr:Asp/Glu racemase [Neohortaea acidophila]KAF2487777.1 Asp/Glu racemase [Neohortaea acidophila]